MQLGQAQVGEQAQSQAALEAVVFDQQDAKTRQTHAVYIPKMIALGV